MSLKRCLYVERARSRNLEMLLIACGYAGGKTNIQRGFSANYLTEGLNLCVFSIYGAWSYPQYPVDKFAKSTICAK
jgi:hypothetical protein